MSERFVDRKDKKDLIKSCPDFKLRRHGVPPAQVIYAFVAALLAVVMLVGHLVIKLLFLPDNVTTPNGEVLSILFAIAFCIAAVAMFSITLIYKIRDIILETEFQNLIFASSARINTDFCLVVNKNRNAIYCDYSFCDVFPEYDNGASAFNKLITHKGVKKTDKDKAIRAIKNGKSAKFSVTTDSGKKAKKYNVTIDPISRPNGYFVVKGTS